MGTKLNIGGSVAIIAVALFVAQPIQSDSPKSEPDGSERFDTMGIVPEKADMLASSSIVPAFVYHQLPVADITEVAAELVLQEQATQSEPANQSNSPNLNSAPENSEINTQRSEIDASETQRYAISAKPSSPVRSRADVTFLKQTRHRDLGEQLDVLPNVVVGLPAMRVPTAPDTSISAIKWPTDAAGHRQQNSTVHSHLEDFGTMLNPRGFQRGNWQDISPSANLGSDKAATKPFVVMIDPGHGGIDPGSKGHNGLLEKDLTLDIARRVRLFLTELPYIEVELTRHHDHGLSRQSRVDAIKRSNADMVISLHFNHLPQTDVNLVESYYAGKENIRKSLSVQNQITGGELQRTGSSDAEIDLGFTEGSARLAKTLQQHIYSEVSFDNNQVQDAGVKQETLFVLTRSFTPAALIEISCLSHADEADRLASDEYRNRLAASLVDGIRNYHDSIQRVPLKKRGDRGA